MSSWVNSTVDKEHHSVPSGYLGRRNTKLWNHKKIYMEKSDLMKNEKENKK